MSFVSETNIALNALMRIKDFCRNYPSDHYGSTQSKINGSTIEPFTPPKVGEIRSFVKCVSSKEH